MAQFGWSSGARVTLPLPVSVVGVCCCVNYSSSRSRRREQPSWNRFKWNAPPGSKQLLSCPDGRDSTRQRRAGLRARPAELCARAMRAERTCLRLATRQPPTLVAPGRSGAKKVQRSNSFSPPRADPVPQGARASPPPPPRLPSCFLWSSLGVSPVLSPCGRHEDGNRWLRRNRGQTRDSATGLKVHGLPDTVSCLQTGCPSSHT